MKRCFKCQIEKPITDFYAHPAMPDGRLGKCKECTKRDVRENYAAKREQYSAYEKQRYQNPDRRRRAQEAARRHEAKHPDRAKARRMINRAIQSGKVKRIPCEVCGEPKSQAHHHEYSKPFDVRFLCFKHHREMGHGHVVVQGTFAVAGRPRTEAAGSGR